MIVYDIIVVYYIFRLKCQLSGDESPLVIVCDIIVIVLYIRLKCQLSGDALHGSWSQLNIINLIRSVVSLLIQIPYPLQLVPVTRIAFWRKQTGIWS